MRNLGEMWRPREMLTRLVQLRQKPDRTMPEHEFWSIIALLDWRHQGQDEAVLAPAVNALAARTTAAISGFEERLAFLLYQLDTRSHAINMQEGDPDYISPDDFLYARCVVVANGKDFYEVVLRDATLMPKGLEFEALLGLAAAAYQLKTGKPFDYVTGYSYESFSNTFGWQ